MDSSTGNSLSTTNTTSATTCLSTNTTTTNNITTVSASITSSISSTSNLPASGSLSSLTTAAVCATSSSSSSLPLPTPLLQVLPLDTGKQDDSNNLSLASGISEGQRSLSAAPSASSSPILSPPGKIFGRNANGTMCPAVIGDIWYDLQNDVTPVMYIVVLSSERASKLLHAHFHI
uniref:Uncharacterized protein n=1 Tax=Glossina austeni TaxID=7395 RepID=A0A1A9UG61_GLOAU